MVLLELPFVRVLGVFSFFRITSQKALVAVHELDRYFDPHGISVGIGEFKTRVIIGFTRELDEDSGKLI